MSQSTLGAWLSRKETPMKKPPPTDSSVTTGDASSEQQQAPSIDASQQTAPQTPARSRTEPTHAKSLPAIPPNVTIEPCQEQYLQSYRRMNSSILPIPYREDFYKEIMEDPVTADITRLAMWHDKPDLKAPSQAAPGRLVAAIRCRIFPTPPDNPYEKTPVLYIATITTLAPFRGHSIASHLLANVTCTAIEKYGVKAVMAHVWEENEDGMEWYKKRGFRVVAHEPQYYRRLAPNTAAYVIRRDVGPGDLLRRMDSRTQSDNP
jgi:ribosomal protein S18 acetylase RimI-like enzyme